MVSCRSAALLEGRMLSSSCDYLFVGGIVVDGTGDEPRFADVAVTGEKIEAVGANLSRYYDPGQTFNITGKVISPGFIDLHTHSDVTVCLNPKMESSIHQGVTTEMVGNCGISAGLLRPAAAFEMERRWVERGAMELDWSTMGGFLSKIADQGVAINIGTLAGHGTIRKDVLQFAERPPDSAELSQMLARLQSALDDGAFGLSTGLEYLPGGYANLDEICALADITREAGGFYASHIRDERDDLVASVDEALAVGQRSHLPVQLSHHKVERRRNWGTIHQTLQMMRDARAKGMDVATDQYPYTAYMTGLAVILLPKWAQGGSGEATIERLTDPTSRAKIIKEIESDAPEWDQIRIGVARNRREAQGLTLTALGKKEGRSPLDAGLDLLVAEGGMVSAAFFAMSEDDVDEIMRDPYTMVGSDGIASSPQGLLGEDKTHPRTYGTFPRVLGEYVRQRGVLPLEEAIRRMTSLPAKRMRLRDRGILDAGCYADIVVFDPDTISDVATFDDPHQFAVGIDHVLVNGRIAIRDSVQTEALAGHILRRPAS
jgi:N-acyl-D-amino-acid deacylase